MADDTSPKQKRSPAPSGTPPNEASKQKSEEAPAPQKAAPAGDSAPQTEASQPKAPPEKASRASASSAFLEQLRRMTPQEKVRLAGGLWAQTVGAPTLVIWQRDSDKILRRTSEEVFLALKPLSAPVSDLWVILNSLGGGLDAAYQIARRLQETAATVHVVIPRMAKSAATLITMGCHEVVMHPMSELGPIDTQTIVVRDDTKRMLSTLDALKSLEYLREYAVTSFMDVTQILEVEHSDVTFKAASGIGTAVMKGLVDPLFSRMDPIHLGEVFRSLDLSREYGKRLVAHSYSHLPDDERQVLVKRLAESYPSHSFVIDIKEALDLGLNVRAATSIERDVIEFGVQAAAGQARLVELFLPPPQPPAPTTP